MAIPMIKKIATLTLSLITTALSAQSYFQQEVNYKINVSLNDTKHELSAFETIEYKNNSTETLTFIWFHLWPNAYKDNNTALAKQLLNSGQTNFYWSGDEAKGYIDSLHFESNGVALNLEYHPQYNDVAKLILDKPLAPGQSITITTPFKVKIPAGVFSRLGHIKQQYQITQWYPKPAVFDRKGWHEMPYLNQGEFYSEYGSFEVKITVPDNYVVAATGDIQEQSEIDWLNDRVQKSSKGELPTNDSFPASSPTTKTLTFKQSKVHDFAWFADKRYWVSKSEVILPQSKRKVATYAYYNASHRKLWEKAPGYINDAIYYYSLWNGDYPYSHCSAVDGALSAGGGMEYPNITVIGDVGSDFMLETVVMHEVGHNWFYGILGSNEREHGWMDEGVNSFNEMRYIYTKYPEKGIEIGIPPQLMRPLSLDDKKNRFFYYLTYLFSARQNQDQPIQTHSAAFTELNYGAVMYMKTATVFDYLKAYLGDTVFDRCMHKYFETWKFKHPYPEDMRKIFEDETGKNLGWFFDDVINSNKKIDYKIHTNGKGDITLTNRGCIQGPVSISALDATGKTIATQWVDGFKGKLKLKQPFTEKATSYAIDADTRIPEINRKNNITRTSGIFRSVERVQLKFLASIDEPKRSRLYWAPVVGWNYYNHAMLGLALYNHALIQRKFEYTLLPLFATGTKSFNGEGNVAYNFYTNGFMRQITPKFYASSYHYDKNVYGTGENLRFIKLAPEINIDFKRKPANSNIQQSLRLRYVHIFKDVMEYSQSDSNYVKGRTNYNVFDYTYSFENKRAIYPWSFNAHLQHNKDMVKTWVEGKWFINYTKRKKSGLDVRLFAGAFLSRSNFPGVDYRFRLSGQTGYQDYLFDNIFLGRNEGSGVLFNQFTETDGAFKMWSPLGMVNNWIVSVNLKSPLPGKFLEKLPIKLYASFGTYDKVYGGGKSVAYEVGPYISIASGIFEIYFPALTSKQIRDAATLNGIDKYYERIRFTLNLTKLNPFKLVKNINL